MTDAAKRASAENWRDRRAPSLEDVKALAAEAFAALPEAFRRQCEGVAILVRDWPDEETLDALGIEDEYGLLGLYEGVDLTQAETHFSPTDVNRVVLYRRPLLDYWAEYDETFGHLVTHVLVHEIGHHFGLSDDEMAALEASVD